MVVFSVISGFNLIYRSNPTVTINNIQTIETSDIQENTGRMPTKTRPIEKFAAAVGKCPKEVRGFNRHIDRVRY